MPTKWQTVLLQFESNLDGLQVCSRCCLRYAGVRADVYATPAPVTSSLCEAIEQAVGSRKRSSVAKPLGLPIQSASPVCEREMLPAETTMSEDSAQPSSTAQLSQSDRKDLQQDGNSQVKSAQIMTESVNGGLGGAASGSSVEGTAGLLEDDSLAHEQASEANGSHDPACRVCLGILQSLDGPLQNVSPELLPHLSERDGGGAPWSPAEHGDAASIADHIKYALSLPSCFIILHMSLCPLCLK